MSRERWIFGGALALCLFVILVVLRNRNRDGTSKINLDELLLDDAGRMSKAAFVMLGSFCITSWIVVFQALTHSLTDLTFGAYITAWVVPTTAYILKQPGPPVTNNTTVLADQVSIKPQAPT